MRKHIAISRRTSLLPLAAALVVALTCGTQAQAGDCNDTDQRLESLRPDKGVQAWAASMRLGRGASAAQTQVSPDHRTTVVRNCNDQGSGSLRNAVSNASSGDTIDLGQLHCSTITLTSGAIEIGVDDLTLRGSRHRTLRIDGNHADRVLYDSGAGTLTVSDLTLTRGRTVAESETNLGGCLLIGGALTLNRVKLTDCAVVGDQARGGGAFVYGPLIVSDSLVSGNTAEGTLLALGGGFFAYSGATVARSQIVGNAITGTAAVCGTEAAGGGVFVRQDLDMNDSTISGNTSTASSNYSYYPAKANEGGGFVGGAATLIRSSVSGNAAQSIVAVSDAASYAYAYSYGGGLRAVYMDILDSTISGNSASAVASNSQGVAFEVSRGGGLTTFTLEHVEPVIRLRNSTVSGNSVSHSPPAPELYSYARGGGVFGYAGTLDLQNSTIAFNTADSGGGIYQNRAQSVSAESTIVSNNTFESGGSDFDVGEAISVTGANNLVTSASGDLTLPGGTLSADPKLAALDDNGGPTLTHALRSDSPAINAGNNLAGFHFDQRGHGFPRKVGRATDIGAFEKRSGH